MCYGTALHHPGALLMSSRRAAVFISLALACLLPAVAWAEDAGSVIRTFNVTLLDTMKSGPKLGFKGRVDKLRPAVAQCYDMTLMTRQTLGTGAAKLTPDEAARLAEAYTRFSVASYAAQFDDWNGERLDVGEARPSVGGAVIVPTWIVPKEGDSIEIDYVLREEQGRWRVIDVLYDGNVSQVAVRRSEFISIFRAKGFAGLIETLDRKTAALERN
jgi:phospholipid transport system substrate-binding protein